MNYFRFFGRHSLWIILTILVSSGGHTVAKTLPDEAPVPGGSVAEKTQVPLKVFVSILPQKYFVDRIGGSRVSVEVMVPPGGSPATYSPSPGQVKKLSEAVIFFAAGVPFENAFLSGIGHSLPGLRIVDTTEGLPLLTITGDPYEGGGHPDPHLWMSPLLALGQAGNIEKALAAVDPDGASVYAAGIESLKKDILELDTRIANELSSCRGRKIFAYHPSYGYFAARYGLKQIVVETGGKRPGPRTLAELIRKAGREKITAVFVQPQFDSGNARAIAEAVDAKLVTLDPLAYDYMENMESITKKVARALGCSSKANDENLSGDRK